MDDIPVDSRIPSVFKKAVKVCRAYIHNMCPNGNDCHLYHPPLEIKDGVAKNVTWFAICKDFLSDSCNKFKCSSFHVLKDDKEIYLRRGEISPELVEAAVSKCLLENLTLIGAAPYCKAFLHSLCNLQNCLLRHLSKEQYKDEVFYEIQDEFEFLFGPPESRPHDGDGFQVHLGLPLPDNSGMPRPLHYSAAPVTDDIMGNKMEQNYPRDPNILMQEIHDLRNEHITMRRNLEEQIVNLENENTQLRLQLHDLTAANTSLKEEKTYTEKTLKQLQNDKLELHNDIDGNVNNTTTELRRQIEDAKNEAEKARETYANMNADMLIQSEIEKREILAEISSLKTKLQLWQNHAARGEDVQQLDENPEYDAVVPVQFSGKMFKVSVVGHSHVPCSLEVTGAEIRIFRAPGGKLGTFFTDSRLNRVLEWKHELCILWLGSDDIVEGITADDIVDQILRIVSVIESGCETKVYVCLLEPRLNPQGINPAEYGEVQRLVNRKLQKIKHRKLPVIHLNVKSLKEFMALDGVHFSEEGKHRVKDKLGRIIRDHVEKMGDKTE